MTRETPEIMCNGAKYYSTKQVAKAQQCKDLHFSAPFNAPHGKRKGEQKSPHGKRKGELKSPHGKRNGKQNSTTWKTKSPFGTLFGSNSGGHMNTKSSDLR